MKRILFICRVGHTHGTGHFIRSKRYAGSLPQGKYESFIAVLTSGEQFEVTREDIGQFTENTKLAEILACFPNPDLFVFDTRETPLPLYREARRHAKPILMFDDYGAGRGRSEAAANILPHYAEKKANFTELKYNPLEAWTPDSKPKGGILISFGGSDPGGIGEKAARALSGIGRKVVWVRGVLTNGHIPCDIEGVEILGPQQSLAPFIAGADTVVTTVGLTMIEALNLGRKVVGIHPTDYHARVAKSVKEIVDMGYVNSFSAEQLRAECKEPYPVTKMASIDNNASSLWFSSLAEVLIKNGAAVCPVCGSIRRRALFRDEDMTLFECLDCRSNFRYAVSSECENYSQDYFEETYRKAYGKTYEEDIAAIRGYSARRLGVIEGMLKPGGDKKRILDIGCAMGVFVDEAGARGWESEGVEVSAHARKLARERFGLEIHDDTWKAAGLFDCVTLWFTLEHLKNPAAWIETARNLLKPGGILGLGLPHSRGWFGGLNPKGYLEARPREHEFEPSISGIKKLLKDKGFKIKKLSIFGLHPARAGFPEWEIVKRFQAMIKKGDTFEIYAEKLGPSD